MSRQQDILLVPDQYPPPIHSLHSSSSPFIKCNYDFSNPFSSVLVPTKESAFNPCFLAALLIASSVFFFLFGLLQLLILKRKKFHGHLRVKSVGLHQLFRVLLVFAQATLQLVVFAKLYQDDDHYGFFNISTLAFLIPSLVLYFTILPLHVIEVHKSIWQVASLLIYWLVASVLQFTVLYQDKFTNYPVAAKLPNHQNDDSSLISTIEVLLFANAVIISISETFFWSRAHEFTHDLQLNNVNVHSLHLANVFGKINYNNLNPLINKTYSENTIEFKDLPELTPDLNSEYSLAILGKYWLKQLTKPKPNIFSALFHGFSLQLLVTLVLEVLQIVANFAQPQLLKVFMNFFLDNAATEGSGDDYTNDKQILRGVLIALSMTAVSFASIILWNEYINRMYAISYRIRQGLTVLVYEKALKLSNAARNKRNIGDIVNLVSVDVSRVEYAISKLQSFVSAPLQFVLCLLSLVSLLGVSSFSGLLVIAFALPVNLYTIKRIEKLYDQNMKFKDMRTKTINEVLNSIKSIKLYSWESPMERKISDIRNDKELTVMKKIGIVDAVLSFSWNCVPYFVSCATFAVFTLLAGKKLTSDLIFPSLALFNLLGDPLFEIPDVISTFVEAKVSIVRLTKFLTDEELDENLVLELQEQLKKGQDAVVIANATFLRAAKKTAAAAAAQNNKQAKNNKISGTNDNHSANDQETAANTDEESAIESSATDSPQVALLNINFVARKGALTCIVGGVGSGKSTFLHSILGQLPVISASNFSSSNDQNQVQSQPTLRINGKIAYCPQQPWIMNASIKKNIIFGHKYDPEFFERTIEACELKLDFEILPDGEETQVGEKGISLSGGQKARISLARAVYARADIYLLDDVLSAVDAHVSKNIIEKVLLKKTGVLSSKTLILSTNHIHVLEEADSIYVLDHGKIDEKGTYDELLRANGEFAKLIQEFGNSDTAEKPQQESEGETTDAASAAASADSRKKDNDDQSSKSDNAVIEYIEDGSTDPANVDGAPLTRVASNFTVRRASVASFNHPFDPNANEKSDKTKTGQSKEVSKKGKVTWSTYARYARSAKWHNVIITVLAIITAGFADLSGKLWLKHWADLNDQDSNNNAESGSSTTSSPLFLIIVYTSLGVLSGFAVLLKGFSFWYCSAINASKKVHSELVKSILSSPMSFFETTPTGRILNRFSEDVSRLDERFPHSLSFFGTTLVSAFFSLGLVAVTLPVTIVFIFALSVVYYYVQSYYIAASRESKRFSSVTRSPVYSHIQETLTGIDTIRAFKQDERFKFINKTNLDYSATAGISQIWMTRWLNFRLKSMGTVFLLLVTLASVFTLATKHPLGTGIVGLLVTYSLQVMDTLNWLVRMSVEVETNAVAVERIFEYCDLSSEKPYIIEDNRPPVQWPTKGAIKFDNYTTRYRPEADPVLHSVSFEVKPREKIGIVGRTGAGKSTLTLALFRIIEASEGAIFIDDVDCSKIGLYDLRSKLNIIPQDSQAFEGTVRQNLDPFDNHKDEELWKALEMAHLKEHVLSMKDEKKKKKKSKDSHGNQEAGETEAEDDGDEEGENEEDGSEDNAEEVSEGPGSGKGLYAKVNEGGSNLSAGQKQLLCLARALLNPSKILLLDEATAAVDVKTDKIVQETIRSEFNDRTILTIAHRIDTILDNDKILVLDKGQVKEFDSPDNLLADKNSLFYGLCERGGYLKKATTSAAAATDSS